MKNYNNENLSLIECDIMQLFPLEYVKNYLRIDDDYDNEFLQNAIATACNYAESMTNKIIGLKTFKLKFTTSLPILTIEHNLYMNDILEITVNNVIVDKAKYYTENGICKLKNDISGEICIIFTTGTSYQEIGLDIRQAIMYHIASIYNNKDGNASLPKSSQEIYDLYRKIRL